jgi:TRAP-type C4-dicarboxylate transport system permease large subunit
MAYEVLRIGFSGWTIRCCITFMQLLLIALILGMQLNATAILLIVNPKFVVIAADSKTVDLRHVAKHPQCKIRREGRIYSA